MGFTQYIAAFILSVGAVLPYSSSALESLSDEELADTSGQAAFAFNEFNNVAQSDGSKLDFTRLTIGGVLEMNANIDRVTLGRYNREALGAGWECTNNGDGGCGGELQDYRTGDTYGPGADIDLRDLSSGTHYTEDVDVQLRNLSMGQVLTDSDGNQYLVPMIAEDPFIELAWETINGKRELVGLRLGQKNTVGIMGNTIDVITGNIRPLVALRAESGIGSLISATASVLIDFSGNRTPGYVEDAKVLEVQSGEDAILGIIDVRETLQDELDNQTIVQLRPNEMILIDNAQDYFINISGRQITYPSLSPGQENITIAPGFGINMVFNEETGQGARAFTEFFQNPNNSFEGNPLDLFKALAREY